MAFLKKLFAFRKRFEDFFGAYQHVLGFPDGERVDGEAHMIGESGFIVLVNPTQDEQSVRFPLDEPELELTSGIDYELTDWTSLDQGIPLGTFTIEESMTMDLAPLEVRYVGVNVAE
jgi:hypothetical protein